MAPGVQALGWAGNVSLKIIYVVGSLKKTKITPMSWLGFPGSKPETRIQMQIVWEGKVGEWEREKKGSSWKRTGYQARYYCGQLGLLPLGNSGTIE